jgi:hypothetical protein
MIFMKHIFIKGFWAFLPMFVIMNLFIGLPSIVSEKTLGFIKPFEYIGFVCFAISSPVYFYIKSNLRFSQLLIMIGVMWGLLVLTVILSGIWPYKGLFHDEDVSVMFLIKAFIGFFIVGFVSLSAICSATGFILKKWFLTYSRKPKEKHRGQT